MQPSRVPIQVTNSSSSAIDIAGQELRAFDLVAQKTAPMRLHATLPLTAKLILEDSVAEQSTNRLILKMVLKGPLNN